MKERNARRLREAEHWLRRRPDHDAHALDFDVEAGIARHRALVRQAVAPPEWGRQLRAPNLQRWLGVKLGAFGLLIGLGLLGWWFLRRPQPATLPANPVADRSSASAPLPTVTPLGEPSSARPSRSASVTEPLAVPSRVLPARQLARFDAERTRAAVPSDPGPPPDLPPPFRAPVRPPIAAARTARVSAREPASSGAHTGAGDAPPAPGAERSPQALLAGGAADFDGSLAPETREPFDTIEMQQVAQAERLLESDPAAALVLVRQGEQRFHGRYFSQERRYLEVMSLVALRRFAEARAQAWAFQRDYRSGPYGRKLERVLVEAGESAREPNKAGESAREPNAAGESAREPNAAGESAREPKEELPE